MKVIKNVLEKKVHNNILNILQSQKFPWYYYDKVANDNDTKGFVFNHWCYDDENIISDYFKSIVIPILGKFNFSELLRVKINAYTQSNKNIKHSFHTDRKDKHMVALYSVNTNDGYTEFENGESIKSTENTLVIFDGLLKHRSVTQTDCKLRLNVNINFLK
jgi:hypothetical protein